MSKATALHLLAICLAAAAWSFSFGLGTQAITHWLKAWLDGREDANAIIGRNHSVYYLGMGVMALAVPWLTKRMGRYCAPVGMVLSGLSLLTFPWVDSLPGWFAVRVINGVAGAMSLIPLETLVSQDAAPEQRTRAFGLYAVALTLGGAVGIWAGNSLYSPGDTFVFCLGGFFPIVAGLGLARILPPITGTGANPSGVNPEWSRQFLSYGTAWFQGFLEGGMLAFLAIYLNSVGMSLDQAGGLVGITMIGVILFQVPMAWVADRLGRLPVLLCCYAIVAIGLGLMPMWTSSIWLALCLFLLGACAGTLYPMALALLGDQLHREGITRSYALFMAMECVGCQLGPMLMGQAIDWWGEAAMFGVGLAALALVLGSWACLLIRQRRPQVVEGSACD